MATQTIGPEDLINYFRNYESRLKQLGIESQPRTVAMPATNSNNEEDEMACLVWQFGEFRARGKRFNENRRCNNQKIYCFECNKKGYTVDNCYTLHPDLSPWYKKEGEKCDGRSDD